MPFKPALSPFTKALLMHRALQRNLAAASLGMALTLPFPAMVQAQQVSLDIPAQSLAGALRQLGQQANLQILYSPNDVANRRSPGVRGNYEPAQALAAVLAGSGLRYSVDGNTVTLVSPSDSSALEVAPTSINSTGLGETTEGTGSYTTGATSTATKLPLSIRETPQSVSVVTRQVMDDQNATSISDVLKHTPGVSVQAYDSDRMEFSARGFAITNYQYDGVNTIYDGVYDQGTTHVDMAIYDRVEVIKGATGLMTGSGDPSATVNLVRKRPTRDFQASITGMAGSWDNYRTEGDVSGSLNTEGTVRGRFVGAYQDRQSYLDHYSQKKDIAYGILEWDLTPDTLLTFGIDHQNVSPRGTSWTGNPVYFADGSKIDVSRSWNPGTDWSRRDFESYTYFTSLEQNLANDWKLKVNVNQMRNEHDTLLGSASGGNPDPATGQGAFFYWGHWEGKRVQNTFDVNVSGPFELFGREHELVAGFTTAAAKTTGDDFDNSAFVEVPGNIYDWDGNYPKQGFPKIGDYEINQRQNGGYLAARFKPADDLSLILGTRVSDFKYDEKHDNLDGTPRLNRSSYEQHGVVTPYAGIVYDLDDVYSAYASYTKIYQPQSLKDADLQTLEPVEGDAYETGLKAAYFDGKLNATLAFFRIEQDNFAQYVETNPEFIDIYRAIDGATTKGLELEVVGEVMDGWNITAGYTYARTRDADEQRVFGFPLAATKPEHLVKLFTTYRLPGELNKFTVGGGVDWQSGFYAQIWNPALNDNAILEQGSYALVNLMTRYQHDEHLSVTLNANNVLDKEYYTGMGNFSTVFYGEPRNLMLTTKWDF
ncbi:outer membrane receptor for ferric coprogen and ferric-rhodotorulic acid [Metapseudomonas resinovorans]|uniref:TonB-dependent siderophore receptor n=1 Tax=Metapseudomonas resinovorans TaxID=53412 RepID=UPI003D1D754C